MTAVVLVSVLVIGASAIFLFNRLVRLRNQVRNGWADIDVQLQRRHDLVPQLVAAVKGYAGHEHALPAAVTELPARALEDRKSVVSGTSASVRVGPGGRRIIKTKNNRPSNHTT